MVGGREGREGKGEIGWEGGGGRRVMEGERDRVWEGGEVEMGRGERVEGGMGDGERVEGVICTM